MLRCRQRKRPPRRFHDPGRQPLALDGVVCAKTRGRHQTVLDRAVKELKKQAARIGANGILLSGVPQQTKGGVWAGGDWTRVSGQAIVTAQPAK